MWGGKLCQPPKTAAACVSTASIHVGCSGGFRNNDFLALSFKRSRRSSQVCGGHLEFMWSRYLFYAECGTCASPRFRRTESVKSH